MTGSRKQLFRRTGRLVAACALSGAVASCATAPSGPVHRAQPSAPSVRSVLPEAPLASVAPPVPLPIPLPPRPRVRGSIALLLPQTGRFSDPANAVRDGTIAAYLDDPRLPKPPLKVYDTGTGRRSMLAAYDQAMADGAGLVIGPLLKQQVEALAERRVPGGPVVMLNYLDDDAAAPGHLFQIGLSPEDEAREAADSAIANGFLRAVLLGEDSDWGHRVLSAFEARYESRGGIVVGQQSFPAQSRAFEDPIRRVLLHGDDRSSTQETSEGAGRAVDTDMVFVAAHAQASRMILPELRFYWPGARGLPVYATAAVHDRPISSGLRNGLRFCDAPLVMPGDVPAVEVRTDLATAFAPQSLDRMRLLALGYDAYRVGMKVAEGRLAAGDAFEGATGTLVLQEDGRVSRTLDCAEIAHGELRVLAASAPVFDQN